MSVEFSNAYQEILLDNLVSIIKQNFIFQTQIKLTENLANEKQELQKKYDSLVNERNVQNFSNSDEKNRIQQALNESMKKTSNLAKENEVLKEEVENLKKHVAKLEENIPITKLKKINNEKDLTNFVVKEEGSSF
jgi:succinate dehydrogenase/fumarate reductase flavoprotein subunit